MWHTSEKFGVSGPHKLSHGKEDQQGFSTHEIQSGSSAHTPHSLSSKGCNGKPEALLN